MNLQPAKFEDESSIRYNLQLETSGGGRFWYTLVVKFVGSYANGSSGRADASYMLGVCEMAVSIRKPAAVVIDLSELRYEWGDEMAWLVPPSVHVPAAVVVGPSCAAAIATLLFGPKTTRQATDAECVFDSVATAWRYVRRGPDSPRRPARPRPPFPARELEVIQAMATDAIRFTSGHNLESFRGDRLTTDAVSWTVEVVGEAAGNLPPETRVRLPTVDGDELVRLRHYLLEHYYAVDLDHLFATVTNVFPVVIESVRGLRHESADDEPPPPEAP